MPKPAFNPNAPHEVIGEPEKPKFDPNQAYQPADAPHGASMDPLNAAAIGASQGLTLGYADELAGGVEAVLGKGAEALGYSEPQSWRDRYVTGRDAQREMVHRAETDQPLAYHGADIAGSVVSPVTKILGPTKGLSTAANLGKATLGGAITAAGGSSADLTKGPAEAEKFAGDVGMGAGLGLGVQALSAPIGYVAGKLSPENLSQMAEQRAVKATLGQNKKGIKELVKTGKLQETGRDLLSEDAAGGPAVGYFSNAEDILPKVQAKKDYYGKAIGDVGKSIDQVSTGAVNSENIVATLNQELASIPPLPKNAGVISALKKEIDYYKTKGPMSFEDAQIHKGQYVFKPTDTTTQTLGQDITNKARSAVGTEMEDAAKRLATDPSISPEVRDKLALYEQLKKKYGSFATADKYGQERAISDLSNRFVSPSDQGLGAAATVAAAASGGAMPLAQGAVTGLVNKQLRERGSAFAARTMDKLSKIMASDPAGLNRFRGALEKAASEGPQALMLTHSLLADNPEYRDTIEKAQP